MTNSSAIVRGNALTIPLGDGTVDLIVTSPPYFALRSYRDGGEHYDGQVGSEPTPQAFLEALWAVTAECWRVLKPTGSLWLNLGDKYSQRVVMRDSSHQPGMFPERADEFSTFGRSWVQNREAGRTRMPADNLMEGGLAPREKSLMGLPWRYAIGCIDGKAAPDGQQWILRAEVVWNKPNGLPESVTDRVRRSHEQWFHLTKQGRYFSAMDEVREPHSGGSHPGRTDGKAPPNGKITRQVEMGDRGGLMCGTDPSVFNPLGKLPGSVWTVPSEPLLIPEWAKDRYGLTDHFAAFPQELPRRIVLGWSPSGVCVECGDGRRPVVAKEYERLQVTNNAERLGRNADNNFDSVFRGPDGRMRSEATITGYACACPEPTAPTTPAVVLDPFSGTGTVAGVARALGRFGVGLDLSADYCRLARWRVFRSGHFAKTNERTNREAQGLLL